MPYLIAAGASYALNEIFAEDYDSPTPEKDPGMKVNTRSTQELLKVIYGQAKVGGNDIYINVTGVDNAELWIVQGLGEGEIDSIVQVDGVDQIFFGDTLVQEFIDKEIAEYWFHNGSSTQPYDANLHDADDRWTDTLRNTAYIVYHLTFDRGSFQNMPRRQTVLKGRKVLDYRDNTTVWSDNHALCLYDWMTNTRYGMGYTTSVFDMASFVSAANYIHTKGLSLNLAVMQDESAIDVRNRILAHFRGKLQWFDGKYYLRYSDPEYESSVMTIRDTNIVRTEDGKAAINIRQPGKFSKPDGLRVKFIDPERDYVLDDIHIGDKNGVVKEKRFLGCNNRQHAANLGVYELERMQLDRIVAGTFSDDCLQLEPHDLVTLNSTALGITNQLMRVKSAGMPQNGTIALSLLYEEDFLYDDDYNLDAEGVYECALPDPNAEPPSVSDPKATEETYNYRLRSFTRLKITFDLPPNYPWFDHVEVWLSYDNANWTYLYPVGSDFNIDNVEEGARYYVKLKTVSIWGTKQNEGIKIDHTVEGYSAQPSSLTALQVIVSQMAILLYADKVSDPDVELYEFRVGSSFAGAIFLAARRSPELSLNSVKPGSHWFWANTLGTNGEYGATPVSASAELADPPDNWEVIHSNTCDYTAGDHDNTERITADDYTDWLKCSHAGGILTGTYLSPEYDIGSSERVLLYVQADVAVIGTGTTWDDRFPSGTTWAEGGATTLSWAEIFELAVGPRIQMKVYYGGVSGALANEVERMEILSAIITGQYFQVEITITDPAADVNAYVEDFTIKYCGVL